MRKKILVTGTAGFIGFHLANKLLELDYEVVGLDNINNYYDVNLKYARLNEAGIIKDEIEYNKYIKSKKHSNYQFIKLDLTDNEGISKLFNKNSFDAVCHLAAQAGVRYSLENPRAYIDSNIVGFLNVLEGCRHNNIKNLSFASSSSVYGLNTSQPFKTSDHTDHPVSLYAATKKSNEMMAHTYAHLYGIQATGLRFFTVYGPWGRPDMAPMLFTDAILNNKSIKVFNNGDMSRDFTYIHDIVAGIIRVIEKPAKSNINFNTNTPNPAISSAPYEIYNIGNNVPVQLLKFIAILEKALEKEAKKVFLPMQNGDVKSTYANTNDLKTKFNYNTSINLSEGISEFVDWYINFYQIETE